MNKFFAVVAATIMFSGTAFAGSETLSTANTGPDWTGFYAGAFVGAVFDSNRWEAPSGAAASGDWKNTPTGITLGYNHKISQRVIIGGELDYSFGKISARGTSSAAFICGVGAVCRTTLENYLTIRARAGVEFGKLLVFGTAGYGRGTATGTSPGLPTVGRDDVSGFVWGLGAEYLITNNLTLKGEYLNADLGRLQLPNGCLSNCFTDVNFQTVRIGLNYQF